MSGKMSTYAEKTVIRMPAGTTDLIRRRAEVERTSPAEILRRAIDAYVKAAPVARKTQGADA